MKKAIVFGSVFCILLLSVPALCKPIVNNQESTFMKEAGDFEENALFDSEIVEIPVYKCNGFSTRKEMISISKDRLFELMNELKSAVSFEGKIGVLKEYRIIDDNDDELVNRILQKRGGFMGFKEGLNDFPSVGTSEVIELVYTIVEAEIYGPFLNLPIGLMFIFPFIGCLMLRDTKWDLTYQELCEEDRKSKSFTGGSLALFGFVGLAIMIPIISPAGYLIGFTLLGSANGL